MVYYCLSNTCMQKKKVQCLPWIKEPLFINWGGYSKNSDDLLLKWYPPIQQPSAASRRRQYCTLVHCCLPSNKLTGRLGQARAWQIGFCRETNAYFPERVNLQVDENRWKNPWVLASEHPHGFRVISGLPGRERGRPEDRRRTATA